MFLTSTATTGVSILSDSLNTVVADMTSAIGSAVPAALGIASIVAVVTIGWKLFKRFTK